ncbi:MAG: hypothetical protein KJN84_01555, partial [Bacteroidia bacterium]|nr:hypothetical protein [Bacteroidia bacterium]
MKIQFRKPYYLLKAFLLSSLLLIFAIILSYCLNINENFNFQPNDSSNNIISSGHNADKNEKQKGAHVFGIVDSTDFDPLIQNNIEWITLVSWGYQKDFDSPNVTHHDGDSVYMKKHDLHWSDKIKQVREAGFKVFFKPHLWITEPRNNTWRADIYPTSDENWEIWKDTYRNFILRYAKVAEEGKADMFCIGIEFSRLTIDKPQYWIDLIKEIKSVYSGKLTYAANWFKEFEEITFWDHLDYIGIQAYFPLVKNTYPTVKQISKGWKKYLPSIKATSKRFNRQILFTEMGYKSTSDSALVPWDWMEKPEGKHKVYSIETQANCYEAFFNSVWIEDWFAG